MLETVERLILKELTDQQRQAMVVHINGMPFEVWSIHENVYSTTHLRNRTLKPSSGNSFPPLYQSSSFPF